MSDAEAQAFERLLRIAADTSQATRKRALCARLCRPWIHPDAPGEPRYRSAGPRSRIADRQHVRA